MWIKKRLMIWLKSIMTWVINSGLYWLVEAVENLLDSIVLKDLQKLSLEIFGSEDFISFLTSLPKHNKLVKEYKRRAKHLIINSWT